MTETMTRSRPDYQKIVDLIAHGIERGVQVYPSPDPATPWTYRLGAISGTTGKAAYDIVIHVHENDTDQLGLDYPYLVHCDCQAGTYGKPCSHAALSLRRLNFHLGWATWIFLEADQAVQGPLALRQSLAEQEEQ